MPSSLLTVDGSGQVYFDFVRIPRGERAGDRSIFSVGSSGGIFRVLGASAHTIQTRWAPFSTLTLLLQRLYTVKYIISDRINQRITKAGTIYYVTLY
jgi:hypothetical protein